MLHMKKWLSYTTKGAMEISQEELDDIDKMFDSMDINHDGCISITELAKGKT